MQSIAYICKYISDMILVIFLNSFVNTLHYGYYYQTILTIE
ncbi:protein of unknown function [Streptococcus thermophilus]|uniref:Uncharacterized protein n=1 Tax=Streptococcus thermophilus TaxID=1308 RepID=A0AAU9H8Z7_STRTR|nr:protein of unknown function [Streptococcus thermophilus]CAD0133243.1 protein of unknown function [Streptococcus thermophilus]CAD0157818.1 protein of unknown function [Streptococcus thermophilus]CAD0181037.1 protein of unknown function [Streptococcus thermophilus]